jgi:hypothetical protein
LKTLKPHHLVVPAIFFGVPTVAMLLLFWLEILVGERAPNEARWMVATFSAIGGSILAAVSAAILSGAKP